MASPRSLLAAAAFAGLALLLLFGWVRPDEPRAVGRAPGTALPAATGGPPPPSPLPAGPLTDVASQPLAIDEALIDPIVADGPPSSALTGLTVDGRLLPLPGIEVLLWETPARSDVAWPEPDRTAVSDEGGRFRFDDLDGTPTGPGMVTLLARGRGLLSVHAALALLPADAGRDVTLVLEPARTLAVSVVTDVGAPVPGARAVLRPLGLRLEAVRREVPFATWQLTPPQPLPGLVQGTGRDGALSWPRPDERCRLTVEHPDFPPWTGFVERATEHLEVVLHEGRSVSGQLTGPDGRPVGGAHVWLHAAEPHPKVETDADGRYRIDGIAPVESALLVALGPEHAPASALLDVPAGRDVELDLVLDAGLPLAGTVVDGGGRPVAGLELHVRSDAVVDSPWLPDRRDRSLERLCLPTEIVTSRAGRFRFARLLDATYRLRLWDGDQHELVGTARARAGAEDLLLVVGAGLDDVLDFEGTVRSAEDGRPLGDALVRAERFVGGSWPAEPWYVLQTVTLSDGSFRLQGLDPGHWRLRAWPDGLSFAGGSSGLAAGPPEIFGPGRRTLDLVLAREVDR